MNVILGVTGCIGAYKSALILRLLQQQGARVFPVMTRHAREFLAPLTLEKLSGRKVITDPFEAGGARIEHIALARESQLLLVAPATANILGKFAAGIADDFLTTLYLSTTTPVVVAPAMNVEMWRHPATQENLSRLKARGVRVVEPESGYLACGEEGEGRLAEPERIVRAALDSLVREGPLSGLRVLVTAGPTIEDIDAVRYLSNRSSGRMGYEMAREAARRGASVTLISGPVRLEPPWDVEVVRVRSASQMAGAVLEHFAASDIVVMAAAVADFRPRRRSSGKIGKERGMSSLELEPTEDILERLGRERDRQYLVGFAAETADLLERARRKLSRKEVDLLVANDVSRSDAGFESLYNEVVVLDRSGEAEELPRLPKSELAGLLWDRIEAGRSAQSTGATVPS